jgi:hypothetical protein
MPRKKKRRNRQQAQQGYQTIDPGMAPRIGQNVPARSADSCSVLTINIKNFFLTKSSSKTIATSICPS